MKYKLVKETKPKLLTFGKYKEKAVHLTRMQSR